MVFLQNNKAVRASQIKVGDVLLGEIRVSKVRLVKRRGVFAPITESGDIVVSGIHASSYIAVLSFSPIIDQHSAETHILAFRRLVCFFRFGFCERET